MGYLKCRTCGRVVYSHNFAQVGLQCGVNNCTGLMEMLGGYYVTAQPGARLDLRCRTCLHICSSAVTGKKIYDKCPMKGCNGTLDRYYG